MELRAVQGADEREVVKALLRSEFEVGPGVGVAFAKLYDDLLDRDPIVVEACSRVAVEEGRVVGHALYAPRTLRIAGCDVSAALIGLVVVAPDCRGEGVGGALIQDVERTARSEGVLVIQLAGALSYYSRFGYVDGYVDVTHQIPALPSRPTSFHPATPEDIDQLTEWSLAFVPSGAITPTTARWRWLLETGHPGSLIRTNDRMVGFLTDQDRVVVSGDGYARFAVGEDVLVVYEAGGAGPDAMVDDLRAYAGELGVSHIQARLPSRHPVAMAMETGVSAPNPEYLIKSLDTASLFEQVASSIDKRLQNLEPGDPVSLDLGGFRVSVGKVVEVTRDGLERGNQGGDRIYVPEIGLIRAILGRDSIGEMVERRGGDDRSVALLNAAFPSGEPFFWLADAI